MVEGITYAYSPHVPYIRGTHSRGTRFPVDANKTHTRLREPPIYIHFSYDGVGKERDEQFKNVFIANNKITLVLKCV